MNSTATTIMRVCPAIATLLLTAIAVIPAHADDPLLFSADPATATVGSMNTTFQVLITNTGSTSIDIAGFSFEISTSDSDITFTQSTTATTTPYIFAGDSLFGPVNSTSTPGQTLDASDNVAAPSSGTTIAPDTTLGLGLVFFDVSPTAATGEATVEFTGYPASSLSDPNGNNVTIDRFNPGTITINQAVVATPESGAIVPLILTLVVVGIVINDRRRRRLASRV